MSRKTNYLKVRVEFVLELDDRPAFDSVPAFASADPNEFIAAGLRAIAVHVGYIEKGAKMSVNLHFPKRFEVEVEGDD